MNTMVSDSIWMASNGIAAAAFACLTMLLFISSLRQVRGVLLAVACAVNAAWCLVLAAALFIKVSGPVLDVVETLRDGAWLIFIAWLLPTSRTRAGIPLLRRVAILLPAVLIGFFVWRWLVTEQPAALERRSVFFSIGATLMALSGLVLLEQLYRAADLEQRWGLKYLCVGIGALFAYDFLMYSHALLYGQINLAAWGARPAVNALAVPLIAISLGRNPSWSPNLRLSHQAAFHTSAIIACGGYLLLMSAAGYYIRNFGGTWSEAVGVFAQVAITLGLLVLLLSGQVRARLKIFIKKHFFAYKYDYRAEWLGLTRRLSHSGEVTDPYQRSIVAVAHILESPAGALWLDRENAYVCVSTWNMPSAADVVESTETGFALFLRRNGWIVDLKEYRADPDHYSELNLPDWLSNTPRARLFIPLFFEERLLGFMLLAQPRAQYSLTWEDLDLLRALGSQVGSFLGQQESNQALAQARQFEAVNRLTAFLMHDLKNIANQQSLIVQNAQRHKHNPEFIDDMIMTVTSSVDRMKRLLAQLQRTTANTDSTRRVDVRRVVADVVGSLTETEPQPVLDAGDGGAAWVHVDPERFSMILGHVIRNAQDATPASGRVSVQLRVDKRSVRVAVIDNGAGMTPVFVRESLFKPFYTTKSTRGMGIGAYQAREFARGAGGDVDVSSTPGEGTMFVIELPAAAPVSDVDYKSRQDESAMLL